MSLPARRFLLENHEMRFCISSTLVCCVLVSGSSLSFARSSRSHPKAVDVSYRFALGVANRFLQAWQTQDHEAGIMMLTDAARQRVTPEKLQEFFSPGSQAAYEIQRGRRLNGGEYVFPIVLFGSAPRLASRASRLVILKVGKDDWAVNRLP